MTQKNEKITPDNFARFPQEELERQLPTMTTDEKIAIVKSIDNGRIPALVIGIVIGLCVLARLAYVHFQ